MVFDYPELRKRIPETEEEMEDDEAIQYFEAHQHRHEKSGDSYLIVVKDLFKRVNIKEGSRILDVGCGYGGFISKIDKIKPDLSFKGVDASKAMIKLANEHIKKRTWNSFVKEQISYYSRMNLSISLFVKTHFITSYPLLEF